MECPSFNLNSFTISLWIYRETDSGTRERLVCKSDASTYDIWAQIELTDKMDLGFFDEDGHLNYLIGSTSITLNTWHLLTYVFALNDKIYLYLDGGLDKSGFDAGDALKTPRTSTLKWWVGRLAYTYNFDGIIDEVRIYNRALTAAEIKRHYESELIIARA